MKLSAGISLVVALGLFYGVAVGQSNGSNGQSGRYSRPTPVNRDPDEQNQKSKVSSRSGRVHYGTVHNMHDRDRQPVDIQRAPSRGDLDQGRRRSDHDSGWNRDRDRDRDHDGDRDRDWRSWNSGFRVGYYQYNKNFRDDYFCYPYYVFNPYISDGCLVSPWYYYSFLPGYVDLNRVVFASQYASDFSGFPYDYQPPRRRAGSDDGRQPLDYAIDDIVSAFLNADQRAVNRLVPRDGDVELGVDHTIGYGVRADDFYDMLMDAVTETDTVDYQVLSAKASDDEAQVIAEHDYRDAWGRRQVIYHRYILFPERGGLFVRDFETSTDPNWF